jgi:DNA-binding transcriptional LysR family regulator
MDRLSTLELFVAAADRQSFTQAAQTVGCSPTAASRAIAALESTLGIVLFRRSTRQVALTDEGAAYRDRIGPLLIALREASRPSAGADATPKGELHITAPTMFGRQHVLPVLARLLSEYPHLSARLLLIDRNVRLVEEGIDIAVRIGSLADSSLKAIKIGAVHRVIVASPDYLARRGLPNTVSDLADHDLIGTAGPRAAGQWKFGTRQPKLQMRLTVTTVDAALAAAKAGMGLASLLSYQVADAARSGSLVEVLSEMSQTALPVHLLFDGRLGNANGRAAFITAMKEAMR